jgi:PKD repeat protein
VSFVASATGGSGTYSFYTWSFGNGISLNTYVNNVRYSYYLSGLYNPTVRVTDNRGRTATTSCPSISIQQSPTPLTLTCNANPTSGIVPLAVSFNAYPSGGSGNYQYSWNFDDGNTQNGGGHVFHTYNDPGSYMPRVTVNDGQGQVASVYCPNNGISVNGGSGNSLNAEIDGPYEGYIFEGVTLDGSASSGDIVRYVWDFGDGTKLESTTPHISYPYSKIGRFDVKLTVYDAGGNSDSDTSSAKIIERTSFSQSDLESDGELIVDRIVMYGIYGEMLKSDDELTVTVDATNDHGSRIDDAHLTVEILELNLIQKSDSEDIGRNDEETFTTILPLNNVLPGVYFVKIIVGNDEVRRVKYRDIVVRDSSSCASSCPAL